MDKAPVYGTGDCRFESYRGHYSYADAIGVPSLIVVFLWLLLATQAMLEFGFRW